MKPIDFVTEERCLKPSMRVVIVTETYPPEVNGVAMTLGRMVEGLIEQGHHVQLVRPRQAQADCAADTAAFSEVLAQGVPIPRYHGLRFGLPARTRLVRLWSRQRPDVVHVATEGPLGWSAVSAARKLGIPVTSGFHTNFDHYSQHYGIGWLEQPLAAWLKRLHNRTAATFVPTTAMADDLSRRGFRNIRVVARGVDTQLYDPARRSAALRHTWGADESTLVVLSVGRVAPEKNLPLVFKAFEAVRATQANVRLVIVGDGPLRTALQSSYPDHYFAGVKTGTDLAECYASADLFLFPSLSETFGNVTLEAMASRLAVVAYDTAAAAEVITHGVTGLVAKPGDESGFIAQTVLAARDPALRDRLADAAWRHSETLDWGRIHQLFITALNEVVARARREDRDPRLMPGLSD